MRQLRLLQITFCFVWTRKKKSYTFPIISHTLQGRSKLKRKLAFRDKDRAGVNTAQKVLNHLLKKARGKHRKAIEKSFSSADNKRLWDCLRRITNRNSNRTLLSLTMWPKPMN